MGTPRSSTSRRDPDGLPDLPDQQDIQERVEQGFEGDRIDILELAGERRQGGRTQRTN